MRCCPLYCGLLYIHVYILVSMGYVQNRPEHTRTDQNKTDHLSEEEQNNLRDLISDILGDKNLTVEQEARNLTLCVESGEEWVISCPDRDGYHDGKLVITRTTYDKVGLARCLFSDRPSSGCKTDIQFNKCSGRESCDITLADGIRYLRRCHQNSDMLYMEFHCIYRYWSPNPIPSWDLGNPLWNKKLNHGLGDSSRNTKSDHNLGESDTHHHVTTTATDPGLGVGDTLGNKKSDQSLEDTSRNTKSDHGLGDSHAEYYMETKSKDSGQIVGRAVAGGIGGVVIVVGCIVLIARGLKWKLGRKTAPKDGATEPPDSAEVPVGDKVILLNYCEAA